MHVCSDCLKKLVGWVQAGPKLACGLCQQCLKWGCVAWVGAASLCPFFDPHPHAPEERPAFQQMVENPTVVTSGSTTTTPGPQLAEDYHFESPRPWQWSYRQSPPFDEAGF
jgi:hypothetical protein